MSRKQISGIVVHEMPGSLKRALASASQAPTACRAFCQVRQRVRAWNQPVEGMVR